MSPEPSDLADVADVTVVGIGADGWDGLSPAARHAIGTAKVLMGSQRQLDLVPGEFERVTWPSPLVPALPALFEKYRDVCVLASGDPMFHGIGTTLVRLLGSRVTVIPHPSSVSLACARLGWALNDVEVVSLVGRSADLLRPALTPGRRVLVLGGDPEVVAGIAGPITVLEQLGGPAERVYQWSGENSDPLCVIAIECSQGAYSRVPGLPDDAYETDGQLTKREVRAISLSTLGPLPGQLLWDVGSGSGSIAIEWSRTHPTCRAIAVEQSAERAERIVRNAAALGVPGVEVHIGRAPEALEGLEKPDAIFIGGGLTVPGVMQTCWDSLGAGGRLVVNAVTLESEAVVAQWYAKVGGDLVRIAVNRGSPVGKFTGWRPHLPVTTWSVTK
ncbi:precorrin-6y C5,15-methyltransferase (decarboxylating) subunit CbiE [Lentzea sp. BCCO 10_0856]|uniref:Precorrin-6y C5,15-methyltransferase (Decarboxylating) subunit CbiE n=1 Tax=Lentzea miocenica TaxID=3095431 RepID=A0ABU4T4Y5_9PSEU|nr:precorrin-6y C5,15-methyltransferase (decarboxylating) subunit CbiE [Lentzea sp. BCCO 10_0856]MDX8033227.1 precorrin-6y C5,15-methyltransferase (decarboxylating) subunit CbiE [Lentzea sp. BCCO 10_0856]